VSGPRAETAAFGRISRFSPSRNGGNASIWDSPSGESRRTSRSAVTSRDWYLDVFSSQTGRIGLQVTCTWSPMPYFAAIVPAERAGVFGSRASITLRSASLMEIDSRPARTRLPEKTRSAVYPRLGCKRRTGASRNTHRLARRASCGTIHSIMNPAALTGVYSKVRAPRAARNLDGWT
jgi:hypothetical protein